jgi:lysophospholipase L1-like esterase
MFKHSKSKDMAPGSKRYLFYSILLLLPLLFFILLETALHLFNYGGDLSLFVPAPKEYHDHLMCNPKIGQRYFFRQNTVSRTPNDYFLTQKPPDCYRIFVLGASTAAGFPYGDGLMFSRILRRRLQDTFPERTIEVVNTAMTAVNSYTLWDILDEIIKQKPDVLLIYAGHNEFYGALGVASLESFGRKSWFVHLYLKLQRFKTVILVRNGMNVFSRWFTKNEPAKLTATLMERIVGQEEIPYESTLYHQGIAQYETNLSLILQKSKQAGIPLIISELVCNLRDQPPFVAQDTSASSEAWRLYRQAQDLERQNRFNEAKQKYLTAKDLDPVRFRAPEAFNAIIHKLAQQHAVPVVPMQKYFEEHSPNGLIGRELMIDHLHPNIDGYFPIIGRTGE